VLALSAAPFGTPPVMAEPMSLAKKVDQALLESCASEAVKWSLLESNVSDPIVVDGTSKFRHVRVDGYAQHWETRIWAFVSAPINPETGTNTITIGYMDPSNGVASPRDEEKRHGMRLVLDRCLQGVWPGSSHR